MRVRILGVLKLFAAVRIKPDCHLRLLWSPFLTDSAACVLSYHSTPLHYYLSSYTWWRQFSVESTCVSFFLVFRCIGEYIPLDLLYVVEVSFCSLIKRITPAICRLCFVLMNRIFGNLLCVWILFHSSPMKSRKGWLSLALFTTSLTPTADKWQCSIHSHACATFKCWFCFYQTNRTKNWVKNYFQLLCFYFLFLFYVIVLLFCDIVFLLIGPVIFLRLSSSLNYKHITITPSYGCRN